MNWLAHAFLSKQNIEFRVGNILPDMVSITELKKFSPLFQEGIRCHKAIDMFTDSHPIVKEGISRLPVHYKRFGGILTDVFYDHFLAKNWHIYSQTSLGDFSRDFYNNLTYIEDAVPADILYRFQRMLEHNIFESYRDISGVMVTLQRIDQRLRRPANLGNAIAVLEEHYDIFESGFSAFFPELQKYVKPYLE